MFTTPTFIKETSFFGLSYNRSEAFRHKRDISYLGTISTSLILPFYGSGPTTPLKPHVKQQPNITAKPPGMDSGYWLAGQLSLLPLGHKVKTEKRGGVLICKSNLCSSKMERKDSKSKQSLLSPQGTDKTSVHFNDECDF